MTDHTHYMTALELDYRARIQADIIRNPANWCLLGSETPASFAAEAAGRMLRLARENGAKSINLSPILRRCLAKAGYRPSYAGLEDWCLEMNGTP